MILCYLLVFVLRDLRKITEKIAFLFLFSLIWINNENYLESKWNPWICLSEEREGEPYCWCLSQIYHKIISMWLEYRLSINNRYFRINIRQSYYRITYRWWQIITAAKFKLKIISCFFRFISPPKFRQENIFEG